MSEFFDSNLLRKKNHFPFHFRSIRRFLLPSNKRKHSALHRKLNWAKYLQVIMRCCAEQFGLQFLSFTQFQDLNYVFIRYYEGLFDIVLDNLTYSICYFTLESHNCLNDKNCRTNCLEQCFTVPHNSPYSFI